MKNRSWYVFSVLMFALPLGGNTANIYVVPGGAGTKDGTSWANAKNLHYGVNDATPTDIVWVKQGYYQLPVASGLFAVCPVYGGFVGNETDLNQRNPDPTLTIVQAPIWTVVPSTAELHDLNITLGTSTVAISEGSINNCIIEGAVLDVSFSLSSLTTTDWERV